MCLKVSTEVLLDHFQTNLYNARPFKTNINTQDMKTGFRQDINGLRAWAVVAVILFHFGVPGFSGGFVGVDIFFVISGFLMTGIIFKGLNHPDKNTFSLLNFYLARAKRIIPTLFVLCCVLLVLGWNFLPAVEYKELGKHAFGAITFISNIMFRQESSGYFAEGSHDKWLLHTWSLSVEWQFYIILPIVLMALWKLRPHKSSLTGAYILGIAGSLLLCIIYTSLKPTAAFYYLPTRAWEMLAGGLVFLLQSHITKKQIYLTAMELLGFALIIFSITLLNGETAWPGWAATIPVIGTCLVIIAGQSNSLLSTTKVHSLLGKWSYSLYLWHWPIVVFLVYIEQTNNPAWITTGILSTVILGWLSFRLIEMPSANKLGLLSIKKLSLLMVLVASGLSAAGILIDKNEGIYGRISAHIDAVFDEQNNYNPRREECNGRSGGEFHECQYGKGPLAAYVIGDSHADTMVNTIAKEAISKGKSIIAWTYVSCPTILNAVNKRKPHCKKLNDQVFKRIKELPSNIPVIIINRLSSYALGGNEQQDGNSNKLLFLSRGFSSEKATYHVQFSNAIVKTYCAYSNHRDVYTIRPTLEFGVNIPLTTGRRLQRNITNDITISLTEYHNRHTIAWAAQNKARDQCDIIILNPLPYLCDDTSCSGSKNGVPIYYDDDHLSERGAALLAPLFESIFKEHNR